MKCLVVDDSTTMRRIIVNALTTVGLSEYLEARNGAEALDRCDGSVDLIITDWNMPTMGGVELTRRLRGDHRTAAIPVLMVTTRRVKADILEAMRAGVSGYLVKPFTRYRLKDKIDQILTEAVRPA